jgi:hypothetical protein
MPGWRERLLAAYLAKAARVGIETVLDARRAGPGRAAGPLFYG